MLWPGFSPYEISKTLLSPNIGLEWEAHAKSWTLTVPDVDDGPIWSLIFWLINLACYLAGALGLTWLCLRRFEATAGRARRKRKAPVEAGE